MLGLVAAAALLCASAASAAVYWGDAGTIGAADLDGGNPNPDYFQFHHPGGPICDVAVSDTHLYWGEWFAIWRVNFEGSAAPVAIVPGLSSPCGIAIDGAYVYWANRGGGAVGRAALDGSQRNDAFVSGLDMPCEVVVDNLFIYWIDWRGIGRARLDGTGVEPGFIPTSPGGCGLAVDSGHLYWGAGEGAIGRASLDGVDVDDRFITGVGSVSSIAVHGGHIYWADRPDGMAYSSIGRATLGLNPLRNWITTSVFNLGGIAVDGRPTPTPLPLPSRSISFGKVRPDERQGSAVIDVFVPERGDLVVTAPKLGWKVLKGPEPPPWREGSFRWRLKVWAGSTGPTSKRIRTQLHRKGWAKVALRISYNETGQLPITTVKRMTLHKHVVVGKPKTPREDASTTRR